jgi:hypothetical protein
MTLSIISHFFNEELMLEDWIKHHSKIFEHGILIDHHSTDRSREIAETFIPSTWKVVTSRCSDFEAHAVDQEVMALEIELPGWKMALNTTEYMFTPELEKKLREWEHQYPQALAFGSRAACLIDPNADEHRRPLWKSSHYGYISYDPSSQPGRPWRFIHKSTTGQYTVGRHTVSLPSQNIPEFLHLWFNLSPWPACKQRKLQIQTRIPHSNKVARLGYQHIVTEQELEQRWKDSQPYIGDLLSHPLYQNYYSHFLEGLEGTPTKSE